MKREDEPITDDEWLLRRVRRERFRTDKTPIISPGAFEPRIKGRDVDSDGISLFREACQSNPADILSKIEADKRSEYGIVKLQVAFLKLLGLTVTPRRISDLPGHVVIPQLNAEAYAADKSRCLPTQVKLAEEASKEDNIVLSPSPQKPG